MSISKSDTVPTPVATLPPASETQIGDKYYRHHSSIFTISKSMLRFHYGCSGKMLRKYGFPDYVLLQIGLSKEDWQKAKTFDPLTTQKILAVKKITWLRVPHL